ISTLAQLRNEASAAGPIRCACDAGGILAANDSLEPPAGRLVGNALFFDHGPIASHLVRDGRGGAAAAEWIEHPVARIGREPEHALEKALRLLVSNENDAALARDSLKSEIVPHVGERLDELAVL